MCKLGQNIILELFREVDRSRIVGHLRDLMKNYYNLGNMIANVFRFLILRYKSTAHYYHTTTIILDLWYTVCICVGGGSVALVVE